MGGQAGACARGLSQVERAVVKAERGTGVPSHRERKAKIDGETDREKLLNKWQAMWIKRWIYWSRSSEEIRAFSAGH